MDRRHNSAIPYELHTNYALIRQHLLPTYLRHPGDLSMTSSALSHALLSISLAFAAVLLTNSGEAAEPTSEPQPLRVMSYNIRYGTARDGDDAWVHRQEPMVKYLKESKVDILGLQEALAFQISDLLEGLPEFKRSGVARDDGKDKGEFSPLLYRHERFELVREGTFWLSATPEVVGSKGWDAMLPRVCSWTELKDKSTGKRFIAASTHFDHMGQEARAESGKLIARRLKELAADLPVVLVGDFNARLASDPIQNVLAKPDSASDWRLVDAQGVSAKKPTGPTATFNGFKAIPEGDNKIDFIFVRDFVVLDHVVENPLTPAGRFVSDHLPVIANIEFPKESVEK